MQSMKAIVRPAILDGDVLALNESNFFESLTERCHEVRRADSWRTPEKADRRQGWLLRADCKRPRRYRTAEKSDEFAPFHSTTSSARASSVGGTVRPSALAVLRLITRSYLVGACTGRSAGFSPLRMRSTYPDARRYWSTRSVP